jgi:molecular chaperone HtpG
MTAAIDKSTGKQTHAFQTEVRQLLDLMINSLYSNREIFLRELISNASDAADKLRFESLQNEALLEGDGEFAIHVRVDREARTITIRDNGIGMSADEVQRNLGTIAHSGTREFLGRLSDDSARDSRQIGQFGVGFYSAFIVAERVTVHTRKAGLPAAEGVRWESEGQGEFTLEPIEWAQRGTEIVLHLRDDADEFLDPYQLRNIIRTYSDHIDLPIRMPVESAGDAEAEADAGVDDETVNKANALWVRPKSELSDEDYKAFYKHVAHDFDDPLLWIHNRVEGNQTYASLLFIPKRAPFDLWERDARHGVKLYVKRIFIMDDAEKLMPRYLRFVRGVIDCDDLPLNVSREILQNSRQLDRIRSASVKRVLDTLEKLASDEPERYSEFWSTFGRVLKEGPAEDYANRERIAGLFRFATTAEQAGQSGASVSLADYIGRMREGQSSIYYVTADSLSAARSSPHLEVFRKHGVEVLLLGDPVDEWWVSYLGEYQGKRLVSAAKGELDTSLFGADADSADGATADAAEQPDATALERLVARLGSLLAERVEAVRVSRRLTDSAACLVVGEGELNLAMQRMLKAAGQALPSGKPTLEINPTHPLVQGLQALADDDAALADWAHVLHDQALLIEGGELDDPAAYVQRVNRLLSATPR